MIKRIDMKHICLGLVALVSVGCAKSTYYIHEGKQRTLTPAMERSVSDKDYYVTEDGVKVGVGDTLLVKFLDTKNLSLYKKEYDLILVEEIMPNLLLFKVKDKSLTIKTANELSGKEDIKYAHPNFSKKRRVR